MTLPDGTRQRLLELAGSSDPIDRAVASLLHGQSPHRVNRTVAEAHRLSHWQHVPLRELFAEYGNSLDDRGETIRTGHQPIHGSKSGTCVVIWPADGHWWCSSCHQSGDAATLVMQVRDVSYADAAAFLTEHYGPPRGTSWSRAILRRRVFTGVVP